MFSLLCFDLGAIFANDIIPFFVNTFQLDRMLIPIIFAVVGVAIAILARRITRIVRKKNEIDEQDVLFITLKAVALGCLFVALLFLVLTVLQYI